MDTTQPLSHSGSDHVERLMNGLLTVVGPPVSAGLAFAAWHMWPQTPEHRPDLLLAAVLALVAALLLAHNSLSLLIARLSLLRSTPAGLARACRSLVEVAGSPSARRLLARSSAGAALGVGLLASGLGSALAAEAPPADPGTVSQVPLQDDLVWGLDLSDMGAAASSAPPQTPPKAEAAQSAQPAPATPAPAPQVSAPPTTVAPPEDADTHVVAGGECLWSISADLLDPDASEADIARAWPTLYAHNRDVIGADPDLILPGQVLHIPGELQ
ncbi:hypothetical protein I6B53_04265 [Schaalia sp. 19OD2882]|uniref:LysM peptidoglycan-binding domain-containing protein n=1 Tax=Schaalia sp. 19OD2882 TaxID=2794089 RepID=UPI001C1EDD06|nr:hypothetical protein [Schaalia sp. 19OD2882]QWW20311.1 hypothetical protein I6B53_04265 [Schaalia sp. 19OD2882]